MNPPDKHLFRSAMSRLGAAVNLVTTDGRAGRCGLAASAVCSVTDTPPTLLVCVNRGSSSNAVLKANGVLCVNIVSGQHSSLCEKFGEAGATGQSRFEQGHVWTSLATGAPALADAVASLDCSIKTIQEIGTHSVIFAEVVEIRLGDMVEGLIYFDRRLHRISATIACDDLNERG